MGNAIIVDANILIAYFRATDKKKHFGRIKDLHFVTETESN
jgi:hypothetical protein